MGVRALGPPQSRPGSPLSGGILRRCLSFIHFLSFPRDGKLSGRAGARAFAFPQPLSASLDARDYFLVAFAIFGFVPLFA